jgi:hypothetical protein
MIGAFDAGVMRQNSSGSDMLVVQFLEFFGRSGNLDRFHLFSFQRDFALGLERPASCLRANSHNASELANDGDLLRWMGTLSQDRR